MTGPVAIETAARLIAATVLAAGLDDIIPSALQEQAKKFHGARPPIVSPNAGKSALRETGTGPNGFN
jgi:hypothetical protein